MRFVDWAANPYLPLFSRLRRALERSTPGCKIVHGRSKSPQNLLNILGDASIRESCTCPHPRSLFRRERDALAQPGLGEGPAHSPNTAICQYDKGGA
jgi:hypothetical protein